MEIIISNNANKPIYEQITSQIKAMIMSGELQAGEAIPSMRAWLNHFMSALLPFKRLMKICKEMDLSKLPLAEGVLYQHKIKSFTRKNNSD